MSFLPVGPCCFKGLDLVGEPRGVMEQPEGSRTVARYHATPKDGNIVDHKAAMILFYDAFGFGIVSIMRSHRTQVADGISLTRRSWPTCSPTD